MKIKLIKSTNGLTSIQKANIRSLKLNKIGDVSDIDENNPSILGRLKVINHLIKVETIK